MVCNYPGKLVESTNVWSFFEHTIEIKSQTENITLLKKKFFQGPPLDPLPNPPRLPTPAEYMESVRKKVSLGTMHSTTIIKPSATYKPRPAWASRPPSTVRKWHGVCCSVCTYVYV